MRLISVTLFFHKRLEKHPMRIVLYLALAASTLGQVTCAVGQERAAQNVQTCDSISRARPGDGVAYTGVVRNESYRFEATIPEGSTGWGAAPGAPFHGFTIFLNDGHREASCINFEVHIHVDLPEDQQDTSPASERGRRVKVGNETGILTSARGTISGIDLENQNVRFKRVRAGRQDEFTITFITPTNDKSKTDAIFQRFLSQLRFW
jgi:hypothetical protein